MTQEEVLKAIGHEEITLKYNIVLRFIEVFAGKDPLADGSGHYVLYNLESLLLAIEPEMLNMLKDAE